MSRNASLWLSALVTTSLSVVVSLAATAADSVVRVDTGPIWNDGDAKAKCPRVCGARKWTGAWRTTTFQKASQCDCAEAAPPPAPPAARDCGTGKDDPGCNTPRNGVLPMLGERYTPGLKALTSEPNELVRQDLVTSLVGKNTLTTRQFKAFLDLFDNELVKLEVARAYAPKVVDPDRALGHAVTFQNGLLKKEYMALFGSGGAPDAE